MRVEIVDIGFDAFFDERDGFIGEKGTLATNYLWDNGFTGGTIYFDSGRECIYFNEVKTKPIYDEAGEPNITQVPMSTEALGRLLADIGISNGHETNMQDRLKEAAEGTIPLSVVAKEQYELLVLIYEELENYGHVTPSTYSEIVKQVNRWK